MTDRICPECGADTWRAAGYDEMREARDRHWNIARQQAIEVLTLQARVAELEDERRNRGRKVERQRRTIRRLEEKLHLLGAWPHDDKQHSEGDPASPFPSTSYDLPEDGPLHPSRRGLWRMRRAAEDARGAEGASPSTAQSSVDVAGSGSGGGTGQ